MKEKDSSDSKKYAVSGIILIILLAVVVVFWYSRQPKPPEVATQPEQQVSEQERAIAIAEAHVLDMQEYKQNNGANPIITEVVRLKCHGCWRAEFEFDTSSKNTANVSVTLDSWKVLDSNYTPPRKIAFTSQECEEIEGRVENMQLEWQVEDDMEDEVGCNEDETEIGMILDEEEAVGTFNTQFTGIVCCVPGRADELNFPEAKGMAYGVCGEEGNLVGLEMLNGITKVLEIAMDMEENGCTAFCVVDLVKKTAEIEWRCQGGE